MLDSGHVTQTSQSRKQLFSSSWKAGVDNGSTPIRLESDLSTPGPSKAFSAYESLSYDTIDLQEPAQSFDSPLDCLLNKSELNVTALKSKLSEDTQKYQPFRFEYGKKENVDCNKPTCTICHKRPAMGKRTHNRLSCPTRISCPSSAVCGHVERHPNEHDQLKEAKKTMEKNRTTTTTSRERNGDERSY